MPKRIRYARWDDLTEGTEVEMTFGPLTRTDFVRFAGVSGDFNPNHHDELFAIRSGFEKVFSMGPLQGSYLARMLTQWLGPTSLRTFQIRFTGQAWAGDMVVCKAKVVRRFEEKGERRVEIETMAENKSGGSLIQSHAVATPQG